MFNHQKALAHELLMKLQCRPLASNFVLNTLLGEFTNIDNIYQSYKPTIQMTKQHLRAEPALKKLSNSWQPTPQKEPTTLLWRCTTVANRDIHYEGYDRIKWWINLLIQEYPKQLETLVHFISILNIAWYGTHINRLKLNEVMNVLLEG